MDSVEHQARNRPRKPAIEGLESRCLLSAMLPDIVLDSATTSDSRSVTFDYDVNNAAVGKPIEFTVYRSASPQAGTDAQAVGGVLVNPSGPGGPSLDMSGK